MKTITSLKQQTKNAKRVSVYLDGQFYIGLDLLTVMKLRLKEGLVVDEKTLIEAQILDETSSCFDVALNYISKSLKTKKEVVDKLLKKGYCEEIISITLEKLSNYGYVDDTEYAKRFFETYKNSLGEKAIRYKLYLKGVDDKIIDELFSNTEFDINVPENLAKKYLKNKEINSQNLSRCYKYLLSKGFSYEIANQVISKYKED